MKKFLPSGHVNRRRVMQSLAALAPLAMTRPSFAAIENDDPFSVEGRNDLIGGLETYVSKPGDTLLDLSRQRDLGILEVMTVNPGFSQFAVPDNSTLVFPSMHVLPDAPREGLVVNLAELRLYYFRPDMPTVTSAIGVGRDGFATPLGSTTIVRKKLNPTWFPTASTRKDKPELPASVPSGPDNPLGYHALYLGWPTYLIHGTNKPPGVGRRVSRGCIRMYPESVERLFNEVPVGTKATTVFQHVKLGWHQNELYLEVHPDGEQLDQLEYEGHYQPMPVEGVDQQIVDAAGLNAYRLDWPVIRAALRERRGIPTRITLNVPSTPYTPASL